MLSKILNFFLGFFNIMQSLGVMEPIVCLRNKMSSTKSTTASSTITTATTSSTIPTTTMEEGSEDGDNEGLSWIMPFLTMGVGGAI